MVFLCVIWSFYGIWLGKQVILSDKRNRESEQIWTGIKSREVCYKYLKSIRESKNGYGFDDIGMGGNIDIKSLFSSVLRSGNHDMHKYCEFLFGKLVLLFTAGIKMFEKY